MALPIHVHGTQRGSFMALSRTVPTIPIQLHPANPRYFLYDGKPRVLITSTEHFGGLINLDFDYHTCVSSRPVSIPRPSASSNTPPP